MKFIIGLLCAALLINSSTTAVPDDNLVSTVNLIVTDIITAISDITDTIYNSLTTLFNDGTSVIVTAMSKLEANETTGKIVSQLIEDTHNYIDNYIIKIVSLTRLRIINDAAPLGPEAYPLLKQLDSFTTTAVNQLQNLTTVVENIYNDEVISFFPHFVNGTDRQLLLNRVYAAVYRNIKEVENSNLINKFVDDVNHLIASLQQFGLPLNVTNQLITRINSAIADAKLKAIILRDNMKSQGFTILNSITKFA